MPVYILRVEEKNKDNPFYTHKDTTVYLKQHDAISAYNKLAKWNRRKPHRERDRVELFAVDTEKLVAEGRRIGGNSAGVRTLAICETYEITSAELERLN